MFSHPEFNPNLKVSLHDMCKRQRKLHQKRTRFESHNSLTLYYNVLDLVHNDPHTMNGQLPGRLLLSLTAKETSGEYAIAGLLFLPLPQALR